MDIKHKCSFKLFAYGKDKNKYQIRLRVTFNSLRVDLSTGYQIHNLEFWDDVYQLVLDGYIGQKGETSISINTGLRNIKNQMENSFKYFEANDIIPTSSELVKKYQEKLHGIIPKRPEEKKKEVKPKEYGLFETFSKFIFECGQKNAWTKSTFQKMESLEKDLKTFKKNLKFSDLSEGTLTEFVVYLRDKKQLKTPRKAKGEREHYDKDDIYGIKNSTIDKKLGYLKWFLKWATDKGYNTNLSFKTFKPTLKTTQKKVIYLSKEELKQILDLKLDKETIYLEPIRDIFIFCCFSSLRYSDATSLKWNDVKENHIEVTTVKTADSVSIEINDMMRTLIEKYRAVPIKSNNLVFPYYANQTMNKNLKVLCKLAGIDEKIRITTYKGTERIDEIRHKWELIGTHTGRKTFIVNALSRGIAPNVVMKWTGHSDYKAMEPYIDIVDSIKAREMSKMNFMD